MFTLTVKRKFDAAHFLEGYNGQCANMHGHTWHIDIRLKGDTLNEIGLLVDFKTVKSLIDDEVLNRFDHKTINQVVSGNPTAENLSKIIYDQCVFVLSRTIDRLHVEVVDVTIWESEDCGCTYSPEERRVYGPLGGRKGAS